MMYTWGFVSCFCGWQERARLGRGKGKGGDRHHDTFSELGDVGMII